VNYFFVFQNKTFNEEQRGGFLWAPQRGKAGQRVSHHETMKCVKQGDIIIHSCNKKIVAISRAKTDVYEAEIPRELKNQWDSEGWRIDTEYINFTETIVNSNYKEDLLRIQPKTKAPFNRLGRGNTGYLFFANQELYEFIITKIVEVQKTENDMKKVKELLYLTSQQKVSKNELEEQMNFEGFKAKRLSQKQLVEHAMKVKPNRYQKSETTVYYRSPYIKELVKQFAEGKCQLCHKDAPFFDRDNKPYLEEHHVKRLADGGTDTIDNVVAICPNFHRKVHLLDLDEDRTRLLESAQKNYKRYERLLKYAEGTKE